MLYSTRRFAVCLTVCHFILVFFSLLSIAITSLGEERANLSAFRLFDLCLFGFVGFLFLLVSGKGCGLWLWHSLDFILIFFTEKSKWCCIGMMVKCVFSEKSKYCRVSMMVKSVFSQRSQSTVVLVWWPRMFSQRSQSTIVLVLFSQRIQSIVVLVWWSRMFSQRSMLKSTVLLVWWSRVFSQRSQSTDVLVWWYWL